MLRAYIPFEENELNHPEDMEKIMAYLKVHGRIQVNEKTIEKLYYDFSDHMCASWLIVSNDTLEAFAKWLTDIDI